MWSLLLEPGCNKTAIGKLLTRGIVAGDLMKAREEEGEAEAGLAAVDDAAAGFLAWTKFAHFSAVTVGLVMAVGGVGHVRAARDD